MSVIEIMVRNLEGEWLENQPLHVEGDNLFPKDVQDLLADPKNFRDPCKADFLKGFFARNSEVCASLIEEHGTFRITHIAYTGNNVMGQPVRGIDRWLWEKASAQALRDRLKQVAWLLAEQLETRLRAGEIFRVRDLGGADAPYFFRTVEVLQERGVPLDGLRWTVVDSNELAITLGKTRAVRLGLEGNVDFVHASFLKPESFPAPGEEADIALAIGIVCSLPPNVAVRVLQGMKGHLKMTSRLFVPTLSDRCFRDDRESYLVYQLIGWHLWPKDEETLRWVFQTAGYQMESIGSERPGGHYHFVWTK